MSLVLSVTPTLLLPLVPSTILRGSCRNAPNLNRQTILRMVCERDPNGAITNKQIPWRNEENVQYSASNLAFNGFLWECYFCHKGFSMKKGLDQHLNSPVLQDKEYRCPNASSICGKPPDGQCIRAKIYRICRMMIPNALYICMPRMSGKTESVFIYFW